MGSTKDEGMSVKVSEPSKGYNCKTCGAFNKFALYVYAHWRDILDTKCERCGQGHSIVCGMAQLKGRKKKVKP